MPLLMIGENVGRRNAACLNTLDASRRERRANVSVIAFLQLEQI